MGNTVAALYVDPRGPYPELEDVECWDVTRDARTYAGPWPVVAHPPCGPWGSLKHLSRFQDATLAPIAVSQVRRFGGVLEHPARSGLFAHCGMPSPGELPDEFGGVTIAVDQVRWGHVARKRSWLYLVGVRDVPRDPPPRDPTHWVSGFRTTASSLRHLSSACPPGLKICSAVQRRRTPLAFARWLVDLARRVHAEPRRAHG